MDRVVVEMKKPRFYLDDFVGHANLVGLVDQECGAAFVVGVGLHGLDAQVLAEASDSGMFYSATGHGCEVVCVGRVVWFRRMKEKKEEAYKDTSSPQVLSLSHSLNAARTGGKRRFVWV